MERILVIDDEPQTLKIVANYLVADGYDVLTAKDGKEGLDVFQKQRPTLVITDVKMPGLSGLEVLKRVKAIDSNTEVIVFTGYTDIEMAIEALRLDASDFITKPPDMELLQLSTSRAFDKQKTRKRLLEYTENLEGLLEKKIKEIKDSHAMLLQSEKLASIGQLAAGVAHEINNPIGFISSNLNTLSGYLEDIQKLMARYQEVHLLNDGERTALLEEIKSLEKEIDIEYILDDLDQLIEESKEGTDRAKKIVSDLKDFSRIDHGERGFFNINVGLESTLNMVWNELKYKADVLKEYGAIPEIECYPLELNQVFMNILVNAAQAIEEKGEIKISTRLINDDQSARDCVEVRISDTGCGIAEENLPKIFDPFFTTKEIGKGTGLGLNIGFGIIEKHKGTINVESEVGKGTTFIIRLPCGEIEN